MNVDEFGAESFATPLHDAAWDQYTGWPYEGAIDPTLFSFIQGGLSGQFLGSGGSDEEERFSTGRWKG